MSVIINPIITNAGLNVFTPMATGIEFTFTHVAVGTGTSAVNASATALQNEIARFTIAGGGVIAGGKAVSINALVANHSNANPQDYNISEIGFYGKDANNNTLLFAIHRQSTTIVRKVAGADIALPFVLGLSALPVENMTVTIDTNTSGALALLGQHVANAHPHTQYKRTLDNTEKLKIANATAGDEAVSLSQMNSAISGGIGGIPPVDLSGKADLAGSSTQTFSVATATANDHAVRKDQFDAKTGLATDTIAGIVEKATQQEMNAGTANVWPDAATIFSNFASSLGTTGYIRLPAWMGGLTIQWGYNSDLVITEKVITFPTPFAAACYSVVCTGNAESHSTAAEIITVRTLTKDNFTWVGAVADSSGVYPTPQVGWWVAIGV